MQRWTKWAVKGLAGVAMTIGFMAGTAQMKAQDTTEPTPTKLSAAPPVTYANRYELYAGINLQNFQAGQDLPKRMNMGGVELLGTYWITPRWGAALNFRGEAGTTPVFANPYTTRPLVVMYEGMAGAEFRGPKGQRAALNFHAYAGVGAGIFNETPLPPNENVGLYTNRVKPMAAIGTSFDFNRTRNIAIRLSPDLILEHFGTETREFFAISGGVVYRFGKK